MEKRRTHLFSLTVGPTHCAHFELMHQAGFSQTQPHTQLTGKTFILLSQGSSCNQSSDAIERLRGCWDFCHTHTPMICFPYSSQNEHGRAEVKACHPGNDIMTLNKYFRDSRNKSLSGLESQSMLVGKDLIIFITVVFKIILDQRVCSCVVYLEKLSCRSLQVKWIKNHGALDKSGTVQRSVCFLFSISAQILLQMQTEIPKTLLTTV